MVTKIDRAPPPSAAPRPAPPERTSSTAALPAVEVSRPAASAPASFSAPALAGSPLAPAGQAVTHSADPAALWGEPAPGPVTPEAFARLSPPEQRATLKALRAERDALGLEIVGRVAELERRWARAQTATRAGALRRYEQRSRHLGTRDRRELGGLVRRAEDAQRRIDALRARAAKLPDTPEAKRQHAALRAQLARELRQARAEQAQAVQAATAVVDGAGLAVERLAVAEAVIDPGAPAPGSGRSLFERIAAFFKLDTLFSTLTSVFTAVLEQAHQRATEQREQARAEADQARVTRRLEAQRAEEARGADRHRAAADQEVLLRELRRALEALAPREG